MKSLEIFAALTLGVFLVFGINTFFNFSDDVLLSPDPNDIVPELGCVSDDDCNGRCVTTSSGNPAYERHECQNGACVAVDTQDCGPGIYCDGVNMIQNRCQTGALENGCIQHSIDCREACRLNGEQEWMNCVCWEDDFGWDCRPGGY